MPLRFHCAAAAFPPRFHCLSRGFLLLVRVVVGCLLKAFPLPQPGVPAIEVEGRGGEPRLRAGASEANPMAVGEREHLSALTFHCLTLVRPLPFPVRSTAFQRLKARCAGTDRESAPAELNDIDRPGRSYSQLNLLRAHIPAEPLQRQRSA